MKPITYFVDLPDAIAEYIDSMPPVQKLELAKGLLNLALDRELLGIQVAFNEVKASRDQSGEVMFTYSQRQIVELK
jgi:hypothetical protein